MKKGILALMLCLLLMIAATASASNYYLIEDSDTRRLTEDELHEWQYSALGYVLNEIYARHGYHFVSGSAYERYFIAQEWYDEQPKKIRNFDILAELTPIEKSNERLIKRVRADMLAAGDENLEGRGLQPVAYSSGKAGMEFRLMRLEAYRLLKVFSGPGNQYYRGAKGRAQVSPNGPIWVCGSEGGWVLVMYDTNNGACRVGYIEKKLIDNRELLEIPELEFERRKATLRTNTIVTDDPKTTRNLIGVVRSEQEAVYLSSYEYEGRKWAYVETEVDNKLVRAFVLAEQVRVEN